MLFHNLFVIASALLLDLLIGDPVFALHPVRLIGRLAQKTEGYLQAKPYNKTAAGFIGVLIVTSLPLLLLILLLKAAVYVPYGKTAVEIVVVYFSVALKDLVRHGIRVEKALEKGDLEIARRMVSFLITRDTGSMDKKGVIRAAVESLSENGNDSVIAPVFWGIFLGAPGILVYRTVNTLDAMWGYRTERYIDFGKAAAVTDDILNFIPSRLAGLLICLSAPIAGGSIKNGLRIMTRDHGNVMSPNAGYPEAAAAGVLGIVLGGPGIYFGERVDKKPMGEETAEIYPGIIGKMVKLLYSSTLILLVLSGIILSASRFLLK